MIACIGRRSLFAALLGAGAAAVGITVIEAAAGTDTEITAGRRPVICGWPTDLSRATMPCVLAPHHPGMCLPAAPPTNSTTANAR